MRKTHEISSYHISFSVGSSGTVHEGLIVYHKNTKHALFESKTTRLSQFFRTTVIKDSQKTCGESVLRYGLRYDKQSASLLSLCTDDLVEVKVKGNNENVLNAHSDSNRSEDYHSRILPAFVCSQVKNRLVRTTHSELTRNSKLSYTASACDPLLSSQNTVVRTTHSALNRNSKLSYPDSACVCLLSNQNRVV